MANYNIAISKVLKAEGGYQALPADSGNYACGVLVGTNYGISAPVLQDTIGKCPSPDMMKNLSLSQAKDIYKSQYWNAIRGDEIKSQDVAEIIFDGAVNQGVGTLRKIVKDSIGEPVNTKAFTDVQVTKINTANPKKLFESIKSKREERYRAIGGGFLQGWLNRLEDFTYSGVEFAKRNWGWILAAVGSGIVLIYLGSRKS